MLVLVCATFWQQQHDLAAELKVASVSRSSSKWRCLQKKPSSSKVLLFLLQWYSLMLLLPKVEKAAVDMKIRWSSRTYTYFISCNRQKSPPASTMPSPIEQCMPNKREKTHFLEFLYQNLIFFSGKTTSGEKTSSYTSRFPPVMCWHPVLSCFSRKSETLSMSGGL